MFVLIGTDIAAALGNGKLHVQLCILAVQRGDHQIRIQNLDILISLNIGSMYDTLPFVLDIRRLGLIGLAVVPDGKALDVHDDFRHVFLDAGYGAELMQHAFDLDLTYCCSGQGGKHDSPQRVAQRDAVASFQRFDHEFAVLLVF